VFDRITLLELRRAVRLCPIFKTSFSRLNPVPRGQATVIRSSVRQCNKAPNNDDPERQASYLPPVPLSLPAG